MGRNDEQQEGWGPVSGLQRTTIRGARYALGGFVLSRGLLFVSYVVLARLVSPSEFGRYAAASVVTGVGTLFAESGMLSALIRQPDRIEEAGSTAFFSLLASGSLLTLAALAVAPIVGLFFHSSRVGLLAAALSGALLLQALAIVPDALLQRRFSFARRVAVDPLGSLSFAIAALAAAANGAGAWALVAGSYANLTVAAVVSWSFARFRPRWRLASLQMWRHLAAFARPVLGSEILARGASQIDALLLGRFKGAAPLGEYRNGFRIAQTPSDAFVSVGAYVLLPALVRLSDQPRRLRTATLRIFRMIATVALPVSLSFLPLGVPIAVLVLGSRWRPAGHAIAGLCGTLIATAAISTSAEVLKAVGKPRLLVRMHAVSLASMAAFVGAAAVPFGIVGVAIAVSASRCLTAAYGLRHAAALTGLHSGDLQRALAGPVVAAVMMLIAMVVFASALDPLGHDHVLAAVLTVLEALIGAFVYTIVLLLVDGERRRSAGELLAVRQPALAKLVTR